ncbi:ATP-binding cassette domain-containing protein [Pseudoclavibacter chungangensis]|uniref:ATP-binding cassette domain-containing protein n=1 Tax=Pseudoclavibacter chungangensis TaxID=587635 RepID=A0A7J5BP84_9MICO|nr:ATP-binding cassette domain-containing protein [Pseudoclavibacter chungangensis]
MIETDGLTKRFRKGKSDVTAVSELSFAVGAGELVAFLGPNGAGKSTSLRMLTTLVRPTSGTARVAGHDILRDPAGVRSRIGSVGQLTSGSHAQRVRDELRSQGAFHGLSRRDSRRRADELIASLDLGGFADRTVQQLSGGQKRRLDVALGLVHAPGLLFLDEPSTGLDPQSRENLWQHILDVREQHGTTVFLTTHYLEEADRFAERVMVMDHGRVIADDTASHLKAKLTGDVLTLGFATPDATVRAVGVLAGLAAATPRRSDASTIELTVAGGDELLPRAVRVLGAEGIEVVRATCVPPTLDGVFLALTGRSLRDGPAAASEGPDTHGAPDVHEAPDADAAPDAHAAPRSASVAGDEPGAAPTGTTGLPATDRATTRAAEAAQQTGAKR